MRKYQKKLMRLKNFSKHFKRKISKSVILMEMESSKKIVNIYLC